MKISTGLVQVGGGDWTDLLCIEWRYPLNDHVHWRVFSVDKVEFRDSFCLRGGFDRDDLIAAI